GPARLQQENGPLAAEVGADGKPDAFLLGGEDDGSQIGIRVRELDQSPVTGVGDIRDLLHAGGEKLLVQRVRPGGLAHRSAPVGRLRYWPRAGPATFPWS